MIWTHGQNGRRAFALIGSGPTTQRADRAARAASSSARRVLPMPGSPARSRSCPAFERAVEHGGDPASSRSRPTNGSFLRRPGDRLHRLDRFHDVWREDVDRVWTGTLVERTAA